MTVSEAIELLGGSSAVARSLGVHRNTVMNWRTQNMIGAASVMPFYDLCKKYKVDIKLTDIVKVAK